MGASGYNRRQMAYTAAAMFGGAAFVGFVEQALPGGQTFTPGPALATLPFIILLLAFGQKLPVWALAMLGPVGAAMIAVAIATTPQPGDGAVFYAWPVLWCAYFFGWRGSVLIIVWLGIVHGLAVASLPGDASTVDRWMDVMVTMSIVAVVVQTLSTRNQELLAKSVAEARTDKLTGLLNRRGFEEAAPAELERARRNGDTVAVATFDIDFFKRINDDRGHERGDRVLSGLGDVFRAETRETDLVARMGGEEFTVVLASTDVEQAMAYAERVRSRFAALDVGAGAATISAGVTATDAPGGTDELLLAADSALYEAKCGGRDRVIAYESGPGAEPAGAGGAPFVRA